MMRQRRARRLRSLLPLIRPSGTFSRWKKREKAVCVGLLPPLLAGEGGRRPDEGIVARSCIYATVRTAINRKIPANIIISTLMMMS